MQVSIYDVFAATPYAGNQAAVLRVHRARLSNTQLVAVAGELSLAETALLDARGHELTLRFATADRIINRCGHATLAAVADHVLTTARVARGQVCNGRYRVSASLAEWQARPFADLRGRREADGLEVAVTWPDRPQFVSSIPARAVCRALGLDVGDLAASLPRCIYNSGNLNALVPVRSHRTLVRAVPDWARLKHLFATFNLTDLHLYCVRRAANVIRLSCRNLFPYGVFEESATGTASVALATALTDRWSTLRGRRGVNFVFEQGIGHRRGRLRVRFSADDRAIWLEGRVFRILTGELRALPGGRR